MNQNTVTQAAKHNMIPGYVRELDGVSRYLVPSSLNTALIRLPMQITLILSEERSTCHSPPNKICANVRGCRASETPGAAPEDSES